MDYTSKQLKLLGFKAGVAGEEIPKEFLYSEEFEEGWRVGHEAVEFYERTVMFSENLNSKPQWRSW